MKVLITGGSGFLGRGLLRRSEGLGWDVTVYSRDEYKQDLCHARWPNARYILGDINNFDRLHSAMLGHDAVIHTAAIKFIPEAEKNVLEAIQVNVNGTHNVLSAATAAGIEQVVCLSTDKACAPVNTYGMTKALVERMVGEYARINNGTSIKYTSVRYGNVVGSTGSVIPLFVRQATSCEHTITLTDPDMTRYWISVDDAIDLILACMSYVENGCVLIPQPMSMRIRDLAELIADQYNAGIRVIGARPGEKRHEQLMHQQESVRSIWDGAHYMLYPAYTEFEQYAKPFILSSNDPKVWLTKERMLEMIEDAKTV